MHRLFIFFKSRNPRRTIPGANLFITLIGLIVSRIAGFNKRFAGFGSSPKTEA